MDDGTKFTIKLSEVLFSLDGRKPYLDKAKWVLKMRYVVAFLKEQQEVCRDTTSSSVFVRLLKLKAAKARTSMFVLSQSRNYEIAPS